VDWKHILTPEFAVKIAEKWIEMEKEKSRKWKEYWQYQIFTPTYKKIWHKITFKKIPTL
jgi:hypothetical protein